MNEYAPSSVYLNYVSEGVRFGACFLTVSLFYNGWLLTILMMALNAFILSRFFYLFLTDAANNRILSFAVLYRVYLVFLSYLTASGTLTSFYRANMLAMVLLYVFLRLLENSFNRDEGWKRPSANMMAYSHRNYYVR